MIEQFESYSNVVFAVVILTQDVIAAYCDKANDKEQNVLLELGYFIGKLGRHRVVVLYKGDTEILSNYHGVSCILMDSNGSWQCKFAELIKTLGYM